MRFQLHHSGPCTLCKGADQDSEFDYCRACGFTALEFASPGSDAHDSPLGKEWLEANNAILDEASTNCAKHLLDDTLISADHLTRVGRRIKTYMKTACMCWRRKSASPSPVSVSKERREEIADKYAGELHQKHWPHCTIGESELAGIILSALTEAASPLGLKEEPSDHVGAETQKEAPVSQDIYAETNPNSIVRLEILIEHVKQMLTEPESIVESQSYANLRQELSSLEQRLAKAQDSVPVSSKLVGAAPGEEQENYWQELAVEARWGLRVPFNYENTKHNENVIYKAIATGVASLRQELERMHDSARQMAEVLQGLAKIWTDHEWLGRNWRGTRDSSELINDLSSRAKTLSFYFLKGEIGTVCDMAPVREDERNDLRKQVASLRGELEEAKRDSARIDWLEKHIDVGIWRENGGCYAGIWGPFKTAREALDNAIVSTNDPK